MTQYCHLHVVQPIEKLEPLNSIECGNTHRWCFLGYFEWIWKPNFFSRWKASSALFKQSPGRSCGNGKQGKWRMDAGLPQGPAGHLAPPGAPGHPGHRPPGSPPGLILSGQARPAQVPVTHGPCRAVQGGLTEPAVTRQTPTSRGQVRRARCLPWGSGGPHPPPVHTLGGQSRPARGRPWRGRPVEALTAEPRAWQGWQVGEGSEPGRRGSGGRCAGRAQRGRAP